MHGCQVTWICLARQCLSRPVVQPHRLYDQSRHGPASSVMQVAWPWDANPVCSQTFIHILILKKIQKQTKFLPKYLTWYWEAEYNNHEIHIPRWLHPLYRPSWLKHSHFRAIWGELTVFSPLRYSNINNKSPRLPSCHSRFSLQNINHLRVKFSKYYSKIYKSDSVVLLYSSDVALQYGFPCFVHKSHISFNTVSMSQLRSFVMARVISTLTVRTYNLGQRTRRWQALGQPRVLTGEPW